MECYLGVSKVIVKTLLTLPLASLLDLYGQDVFATVLKTGWILFGLVKQAPQAQYGC